MRWPKRRHATSAQPRRRWTQWKIHKTLRNLVGPGSAVPSLSNSTKSDKSSACPRRPFRYTQGGTGAGSAHRPFFAPLNICPLLCVPKHTFSGRL